MKSKQPLTLTRFQSRQVDEIAINQFGLPGIVLMENAGRGCVEALLAAGCCGPVVVCSGTGNNGGDGFVIARHLAIRGIRVKTMLVGPQNRAAGDALTNLLVAERCGIEILEIDEAIDHQQLHDWLSKTNGVATEWIVDAMLGTGASGDPRTPISNVVDIANKINAKRVAIDVPTGLDCETGDLASPCFCADLTLTFVALKIGFHLGAASTSLGKVQIINIGIDNQTLIDLVQ